MTYLPRDIGPLFSEALQDMPVVMLTGMRQTGKSTFLLNQPELSGRRTVSLDDFATLAAARDNPDGFIDGDEPITIDEVQRCPELFLAIKRAVDRRRVPGQFILSGSANFLLMKNLADSLAGRAIHLRMPPFTRRELAGKIGNPPLLRRLLEGGVPGEDPDAGAVSWKEVACGGMPTVCLGGLKKSELWFKGYEQTYLERDIRDLGKVGNLVAFRTLLRLAALRTGKLLVPSELARDARLSVPTVNNYLSLMEVSCVANRLPPFFGNASSRLIKSPKLYLADSGLSCFLADVSDLADHPLKGALFETYVAQNLFGILDAAMPHARVSFWNVQGRQEIDFVIEAGGACVAIEVKSTGRIDSRDLSGLKAFLDATPSCVAGILAYNGKTTTRLSEQMWAIPVTRLLS